ncbi:MAG: InlB B-repeat-containing protein [Coriobacteriia bacterium]|nr:InlB B-repeat-containing protein [Coriobacteriia bacterium]
MNKHFAKLLIALPIIALCLLVTLPATAPAAPAAPAAAAAAANSTSRDGLTATVTTDKASYKAGETVKVTMSVTNTNSYAVNNVQLKLTLPAGLTLQSGQTSCVVGTLAPGAQQNFTVTATANEAKTPDKTKPKTPSKPKPKTKTKTKTKALVPALSHLPLTGDSLRSSLWSMLILLSVSILITTLLRRGTSKHALKILSVFFCCALALLVVGHARPALAATEQRSLSANQAVTINGAAGEVTLTVTYDYELDALAQAPFAIAEGDQVKTYGDADFTLTATGGSTAKTVVWESSDPTVATVTPTDATHATVTLLNASAAPVTITATMPGSVGNTGAAPDYLDATTNITLTVNKAVLTVTAADQARDYGADNPDFTFTYSGWANGEDESVLTTAPTVSCAATSASDKGNYPIDFNNDGVADNYTFDYVSGTLTINAVSRTIAVAGAPATITYGDSGFTLTATALGAGTVTWSSSNTAVATVDIVTGAVTIKGAGDAAITAAITADGNYTAASESCDITVNKAMLTVNVASQSKLMGQPNPTPLTYTVAGFVPGESEADLTAPITVTTTATTSSAAGTYDIIAAGGASNNYDFTYNKGTLTVNSSYGLTFDANGGTNPPAAVYVKDSGTMVVNLYGIVTSSMTPPASGQTFVGWDTKADGTGTFYDPTNTATNVPMTSDITLYAMWSGDGSSDASPILVYDYATLNAVRNGLDKCYKVIADIDAGAAWVPISSSPAFTGTFDGNNKTITFDNVTFNQQYAGLFGCIGSGGMVENLNIAGNITSTASLSYTGGVAGVNYGTVQNCAVLGDVNSTNSNSNSAGGVVGNNPGTVQNCYSTGNVTGAYNQVGGVVGRSDGMVQNCYSTGDVTGAIWVGGVVGNSNGTVQNCYALGNVEGSDPVGGVVGRSYGTVQNCAALNASVTATGGTNAGRVVGQNVLLSPLANNYAIAMSGLPMVAGTDTTTDIDGATISTSQATTQAFWSPAALFAFGADDASPWVWGAFPDYPLPTLYWQTKTLTIATQTLTYDANGGAGAPGGAVALASAAASVTLPGAGSMTPPPVVGGETFVGWGTKDDGSGDFYAPGASFTFTGDTTLYALWSGNGGSYPILVYDHDTLDAVRNRLGANYKVVADINAGNAWIPIGANVSGGMFSGTFNGNGHTITLTGFGTLTADSSGNYEVGLFGVSIGQIQDVSIAGSVTYTTNTASYVGAVAGYLQGGTVQNCVVTANVTGTVSVSAQLYVGGIAGMNGVATIKNCSSTGDVTGTGGGAAYTGGIVGGNGATVTACYATGSVQTNSNTSYAGGIVGVGLGGAISNCVALNSYVTATSTNVSYCGRVVGRRVSGTLSNNYAIDIYSITPTDATATGIDGETITDESVLDTQDFYTGTLGWAFGANDANPWMMGSDYDWGPLLWWQTPATPPPAPPT